MQGVMIENKLRFQSCVEFISVLCVGVGVRKYEK